MSSVVPFDLGFLIDGSRYVGKHRFKLLMQFVKYVYKPFSVSKKGVHVGLVVFTNTGKLQIGLQDHFKQATLNKAVNQVSYPRGKGHSLGQAVIDTKRILFDVSGRKNVRKALVTIVVGKSDDKVASGATGLKTDGITSVVIGIGKNNQEQIETLASSNKHYYIDLVHHSLAATIDGTIQKIGKRPSGNLYVILYLVSNLYLFLLKNSNPRIMYIGT